MEIRKFVFLTSEGSTFPPESESFGGDIDNLQVIGFGQGKNSKDAFENLLKENKHLIDTNFDDIFSYELAPHYEKTKEHHFLSELRRKNVR